MQSRYCTVEANYRQTQLRVLRGSTTVLKVGGTILRAERAKIFFDPPLFGQWGDKILLR